MAPQTVAAAAQAQTSLGHVLWIGGATDSGKTSIAQALAAKYGLHTYHYDRFDRLEPPGHWARVDPARHPSMHAWLGGSLDEQWVLTTPEAMVAGWRLTAAERFGLTLEDLLALPPGPVIAEGYGLLPELVAPFLHSLHQAVWLVPTEDFKRASYARREQLGDKGRQWPQTSKTKRLLAAHPWRAPLRKSWALEMEYGSPLKLLRKSVS